MLRRVLTAVVLIPVVVAVVWWGPSEATAALAALVVVLALDEFVCLAERLGMRAYRFWTFFCALGLVFAQWSSGRTEIRPLGPGVELIRDSLQGMPSVGTVLLLFVFGATIIALTSRQPVAEVLPSVAASSGGILFVALPFSCLVRLLVVAGSGRQLVLFTLALVWAGDMVAYLVGNSVGRLPMAPLISPKKTWEGAAGNVLASAMVGILFARWMNWDVQTMVLVAVSANVAGQVGDLIESAFKRGARVKDSGGLLPGHGGMLDRIDSLIFASPVVLMLTQVLGQMSGRPMGS